MPKKKTKKIIIEHLVVEPTQVLNIYMLYVISFLYEFTLILLTWVQTWCMYLSCITYKFKRSMDLWNEMHGLFTLDDKFHVYAFQNGLMTNIIIVKDSILVRNYITKVF